jgi:trk system potassium uptake protein TrkA
MFVVIAGGGRTGSHLATVLLEQGHEVHVIESRTQVLAGLHSDLPAGVLFEGDPTDPQVLEAASIQRADVVAAVTAHDEDNLVIASLARNRFHVPRIIGRVNTPGNAWLFTPEFGVDVALNQADVMAKLIQEEMSLGDMMTLLKLSLGNFSLVEEKIYQGAQAAGQCIKDLPLSEHAVISGILRHGEMILPRGSTLLKAGDEVLALVDGEGRERLARLLGRPDDAAARPAA